jgi:carbamoyl-phosphate synthase/aspartate carbamoyltransferase/dihydroorotase
MPTIRLPGLIDPHVHLREPGGAHKEDFATGTRAALAGGITTVFAMPNTQPPLIDHASLRLAEDAATARSACDYGLYLGASEHNIEQAAMLAPRTVGLKFYLDATFGPLHLKDLRIIREHFARWPKDKVIACHAEGRNTATVILCAILEKRAVHICHVSRREEIELIRDAKMHGVDVTCEVCPHHLYLAREDIPGGRGEVRPTLATRDDVAALWANMAFVDCIATDHAPHLLSEKDGPTPPPGFPGLETSLALMLTAAHAEKITLEGIRRRMADNPRAIWGLSEQPETYIEVDLEHTWTPRNGEMVTKSNWTPFDGWALRGRVVRAVLRGQTLYEYGRFNPLAVAGIGQNVAGMLTMTKDVVK